MWHAPLRPANGRDLGQTRTLAGQREYQHGEKYDAGPHQKRRGDLEVLEQLPRHEAGHKDGERRREHFQHVVGELHDDGDDL